MRVSTAALAILILASSLAHADQSASSPEATRTPWTIGPYVGLSRHSPVGRLWGLTPDRHHVLVGIRATIPMFRGKRWTFAYAPEVIPLILVSNNPNYRLVPAVDGGPSQVIEDGRSWVAGAGIAPIGLELDVDVSRRVSVYAAGALGGLWFARRIPVVDARSFNFTFDFGGGLRFRVDERTWLGAGYKFHHLSNAKTAPNNPGVDAKVFLVGVERAFRR